MTGDQWADLLEEREITLEERILLAQFVRVMSRPLRDESLERAKVVLATGRPLSQSWSRDTIGRLLDRISELQACLSEAVRYRPLNE